MFDFLIYLKLTKLSYRTYLYFNSIIYINKKKTKKKCIKEKIKTFIIYIFEVKLIIDVQY